MHRQSSWRPNRPVPRRLGFCEPPGRWPDRVHGTGRCGFVGNRACVGKQPKSGLCRSQKNQSTILVAGFSPRFWMAQTVAYGSWGRPPRWADAAREAKIGQSARRVVEAADQRPAEALCQNGFWECFLVWAQSTLGCLQFQGQDAPIADHHQIGKTGIHARADQNGLTSCAAGTGFGDLLGVMVDDGRSGQGDAQRLHDGALQIGLGSATTRHRATLREKSRR